MRDMRAARPGRPRPPGLREASSFDEFWPHYLAAHSHPVNRALHYVGTVSALGAVTAGALTCNPLLVISAVPIGYGPAWLGHLLFEKNRPATFAHPLWSLRGDLKMLGMAALSAASTLSAFRAQAKARD